jgi:hypothetical protein
MVRAVDAVVLEHGIGLRIFFGKRVACDLVVLKELADFHGGACSCTTGGWRPLKNPGLPRHTGTQSFA